MPVTWENDIQTYLSWLRAANQAKRSVNLRRKQLDRLARCFPDLTAWELTLEDLAWWLSGQDWVADTLSSHRSALRGFYKWGLATGRIDTDPSAALPSVKQKRARARPIPEHIITDALLEAGEREELMMRLGRYAGMRCCEIALVHRRDIVEDLLGWSIVVHGKGGHERLVPLEDRVLIAELLEHEGYIFRGSINGHLSAARVSELLSDALPGEYTGHQLRHSFGTTAYQLTGDIRAVQELLGHASVATTQIYTHVPNEKLRSVVAAAGTNYPPRAMAA